MKNRKKLLLVISILAVLLLATACSGSKEAIEDKTSLEKSEEVRSLLVYSGAGLKNPMEEIRENFETEHNIELDMIYAGSGQLLAQLSESGKGDIFIVGSKDTYDQAVEKNLAEAGYPVAHHTPVMITQKGNPKSIEKLEDLSRDGIKIALGEEKSNAIGKTSRMIFEKNGLSGVEENVVVNTATVNELYGAIEGGNADVAIVTLDGALKNDNIDIVKIADEKNIDQIIYGSELKTSENIEAAKNFMDYLTSDTGKSIFKKFGFKPVD